MYRKRRKIRSVDLQTMKETMKEELRAELTKDIVGSYKHHHRKTAMTPADANWGGKYFMNYE